MQFGFSPTCLSHDPGPRHPESPDRLRAIRERLTRHHGVEYHEADPAAIDTMALAHDREYLESVRDFCDEGGGHWDADTIAVEDTWDAVRASAGQARWAAQTALAGAEGRETPFAIGRPPGHHAVPDDAMGFCFVNNVAVAAEWALAETAVERVAIVDWDVHHGNGTQAAFLDRGDVCLVSLHESGLYPGTGDVREVGEGDGRGTTVNLPMPTGAGDADYLAAFDRVVEPTLERHNPDLLLVSAGFDAHQHDPISRIRLSTEGYACMTERLQAVADRLDAALAFVLEGGYALEQLSDAVAAVHETVAGRDPVVPDEDATEGVEALLASAIEAHGL